MEARATTFYALLLTSFQLLLKCHVTFAAGGKWDPLRRNLRYAHAAPPQRPRRDVRPNQLRTIKHLSPQR